MMSLRCLTFHSRSVSFLGEIPVGSLCRATCFQKCWWENYSPVIGFLLKGQSTAGEPTSMTFFKHGATGHWRRDLNAGNHLELSYIRLQGRTRSDDMFFHKLLLEWCIKHGTHVWAKHIPNKLNQLFCHHEVITTEFTLLLSVCQAIFHRRETLNIYLFATQLNNQL